MQKNWKDEMLRDNRIAGGSGGSGFEVDPEKRTFPEQLQCIRCGRLASREEFLSTQKCPDCGGGMFKAVQGM